MISKIWHNSWGWAIGTLVLLAGIIFCGYQAINGYYWWDIIVPSFCAYTTSIVLIGWVIGPKLDKEDEVDDFQVHYYDNDGNEVDADDPMARSSRMVYATEPGHGTIYTSNVRDHTSTPSETTPELLREATVALQQLCLYSEDEEIRLEAAKQLFVWDMARNLNFMNR